MAERDRRRGWIGIATAAVGVAVAAGVAAERAYVSRDRKRFDPFEDEPYGEVRGRSIGPVASSDGTLINVEEVGGGRSVVLAHGFSLNLTLWHHQIQDLAGDVRLVMYEQRGHGRSGRPPSDDWSLEALARDLDAVINDASPDEPVVVVGHSMGGMAALKYCEMFPEKVGTRVKGLMLVDTTAADVMGGALPGAARRLSAAFQMVQSGALRVLAGRPERLDAFRQRGRTVAYLGARFMGFGPMPSPKQVAFLDRMLSEVPSEVWLKLIPSLLGHNVEESLPAIDVPTLIVVGSHDRLTPPGAAERMATAIADAEKVVIESAGHTPMLERPDVFNDLVRRFVARAFSTASR